MPLPARLFPGDEELGKRDDDHIPGKRVPLGVTWQQRRIAYGPHQRTIKKVALGMLALIALYYFFKNMPTDLENPRTRPNYDHTPQNQAQGTRPSPPSDQGSNPKNANREQTESLHYFNGPIKFYQLAQSLHAVSRTKGSDLINRNVVSLLHLKVQAGSNIY